MAAPTAGPAPDGSTTRKARCTGSSTCSAGTPHPGTATAPARRSDLPHIVGAALFEALAETTTWDVIVDHTALLVAFGGLPVKNTAVMPGGTTAHPDRDYVGRYRARGGRLVSVSPLRDDIAAIAGPLDDRCRWLAPVPGTDVAIMLGLAYVLATESLADRAFLGRYCTGYERFERYLLGLDDGIPKTPEWAAALSSSPPAICEIWPAGWPSTGL